MTRILQAKRTGDPDHLKNQIENNRERRTKQKEDDQENQLTALRATRIPAASGDPRDNHQGDPDQIPHSDRSTHLLLSWPFRIPNRGFRFPAPNPPPSA